MKTTPEVSVSEVSDQSFIDKLIVYRNEVKETVAGKDPAECRIEAEKVADKLSFFPIGRDELMSDLVRVAEENLRTDYHRGELWLAEDYLFVLKNWQNFLKGRQNSYWSMAWALIACESHDVEVLIDAQKVNHQVGKLMKRTPEGRESWKDYESKLAKQIKVAKKS